MTNRLRPRDRRIAVDRQALVAELADPALRGAVCSRARTG
jgi:hypothetical protein